MVIGRPTQAINWQRFLTLEPSVIALAILTETRQGGFDPHRRRAPDPEAERVA